MIMSISNYSILLTNLCTLFILVRFVRAADNDYKYYLKDALKYTGDKEHDSLKTLVEEQLLVPETNNQRGRLVATLFAIMNMEKQAGNTNFEVFERANYLAKWAIDHTSKRAKNEPVLAKELARMYHESGEICYKLGNEPEAAEMFESEVKMSKIAKQPESIFCHYRLADIYRRSGKQMLADKEKQICREKEKVSPNIIKLYKKTVGRNFEQNSNN